MEVEDAEIHLMKKTGGFTQIHIGQPGFEKPNTELNLNDDETKQLSNALKIILK